MKPFTTFVLLITLSLGLISLFAQTPDYEKLKSEAEASYAEGSYARAHEGYVQAGTLNLSPAQRRWVEFRQADTLWRSEAATQTADTTKLDQARHQLEVLVRDIQRPEDRDLVWAEVQESLGDFWWTRRNQPDWGQAWPHYQQALDWWAGSADIEAARDRYLKLVWKMTRPSFVGRYYSYGNYGLNIPLDVLENALKIAKTADDKAQAHYLLAMTLRSQAADTNQRRRIPEEFEGAIRAGKSSDWYDDALYQYAQWLENTGRVTVDEEGQEKSEPDYVRALEMYRRLVSEYQKGESRYFEPATQQIKNITSPSLGVFVSTFFLPGSEIQFNLSWRNLKKIDFELYKVDLTRDVDMAGGERGREQVREWIQSINLGARPPVKSWSKETQDKGDYRPGSEAVRLENKLPVGAYLLKAAGAKVSARDLILVTDTSLVLKTTSKQALVYLCNALDGAPIAEASVTLWESSFDYQSRLWISKKSVKQTNAEGIAVFDVTRNRDNTQLFVSAITGERQAFSLGNSYNYGRQEQPWRIYAFTDRPAYRPKEDAHWKLIARRYNGSVYSTPSNQTLEFQITDARGSNVKEGKITLNAFGSAWGSLELTDAMTLGVYRVTFWDEGRRVQIGSANLFRLEEYKLPEFKVSVQTPEEGGKKKSFRVGESVEVNIRADYYFGGPVSDASVEVLVHQNPFYHTWYPPHDFPWYYEDMTGRSRYYGGRQGQVIKHETLKTDATGKASLSFDTPRGDQQDLEYFIEARVTDASRREIEGSGTVRVTHQRYYVYPHTQHNLYRPQEKVTVDVKALDANEQPVEVEGTVKVTREYWYEIWIDPTGKEVRGDELTIQRRRWPIFPPPPDSGGRPWRLKFRGYQHEDILKQTLKTDAEGQAELTFVPAREGYYQITWGSRDKDGTPIKAQTTVWVCKDSTTELGYRRGGVEIIVDKDTFHVGQKAPVLLNVPTNDRYVLFSIEGDDLYSYQLVHVTGTVKLLEITIEEKHVPNIFLSATMVNEGQIFLDTKQIVVPPVQQFLTVDVKADRAQYQPREEGTLVVTTRTYDGKPVAAEVGLGLVDESVYYIQQDYAGDPRQFFYGTKRYNYIQNQSTFSQKSFTKLVEGPNKELVDERQLARESTEELNAEFGAGGGRGVAGGMVGGVVGGVISKNGRMDSKDKMMLFESMGAAQKVTVLDRSEMRMAITAPAAAPMQAEPEPAVQVRTDFRATVFWQPDVVTDKDGKATVKVKFPDSLTTWKATARVESEANQFGIASSTTRTQQPLIVRLQAPRFFLVGDQVIISAVMNNNTDKPMTVTPSLDAQGLVVTGIVVNGSPVKGEQSPVQVSANGEARADWVVSVQKPGEAKLKVTGRGGTYADAMEKSFPVYEHGIEKFIAKSGKMRGDEVTIKLDIPKERKPESTVMTVQVAPSMAVTMLDALPYLIDYPYGCTEQTMSRFLPAVVVAKTLKDLGLRPELVMGKVFGGVVPEFATQTHPRGPKDLQLLDDVTQQSLKRLYDFQHSDGGWGWWKEGSTDPFMTAYIVWGLTLARDAGIKLKPEVLDRGADYLEKTLVEQETNFDLQAWMLHAVTTYHQSMKLAKIASPVSKAFDNLWKNRDQLNAYTRALLALSANHMGYTDQARTLIRNLENGVKIDTRPDVSIIQKGGQGSEKNVIPTAHWGEDGIYWRWSDGGVEATSFALRALLAIDPQNKLVEPVTNWLIKNRRGAQWNSTRDTAITILSLTDYLRSSGELRPEVEYELSVNGHMIVTKKVTPDDALTAPSLFPVDAKNLVDGVNEIRIKRKGGSSPLYFSAQARYFSLEEPIAAAGNEIFVRRQYYKLVGHPTLLKGYVYDRQPLNDGESVTSGDRVQTVLTIEGKNNYEYLVFEDLKPAGLEAVQIRSGEPMYARELKSEAIEREASVQSLKFKVQSEGSKVQSVTADRAPKAKVDITTAHLSESSYTGRSRWVYQELRDRKVALFIDKLPQGVWEIRYDLRAEAPGKFHAMPTLGYAMYVPEIRTNGTEVRITIEDRK